MSMVMSCCNWCCIMCMSHWSNQWSCNKWCCQTRNGVVHTSFEENRFKLDKSNWNVQLTCQGTWVLSSWEIIVISEDIFDTSLSWNDCNECKSNCKENKLKNGIRNRNWKTKYNIKHKWKYQFCHCKVSV